MTDATPAAGSTRTVVLVHGAFADGACWADIIRLASNGNRLGRIDA